MSGRDVHIFCPSQRQPDINNLATKPKIRIVVAILILGIIASIYGYYELVLRRPVAGDDPYALWMAALKGFQGPVRYFGDADDYSYFVVGSDYTPRYKRPVTETSLPKYFPLGTEEPYRVTQEMVPRYMPPKSEGSTKQDRIPLQSL